MLLNTFNEDIYLYFITNIKKKYSKVDRTTVSLIPLFFDIIIIKKYTINAFDK